MRGAWYYPVMAKYEYEARLENDEVVISRVTNKDGQKVVLGEDRRNALTAEHDLEVERRNARTAAGFTLGIAAFTAGLFLREVIGMMTGNIQDPLGGVTAAGELLATVGFGGVGTIPAGEARAGTKKIQAVQDLQRPRR